MAKPHPATVPDSHAAMQQAQDLARRLMAVPKREVDQRIAKDKKTKPKK